ncbi:MAG TPA: argininosuccinate lyase [Actinomycetota bacterium]|nr:argininosuccinate lyase [Actinomycetota bacterium]
MSEGAAAGSSGASGGAGARRGEPLWGGRFGKRPAPEAQALGRSLGFDVRLAPHDVEASVAHARALEAAGLLTAEEAARLEEALREVGAEIAEGRFAFDPADEDVHSAIERGVTERLGELGARLHAGRSRNDLVATDVRLWMREASRRVGGLVRMLARALVARAREHAGTVMPGTTHGRPAQVVTLGHHLLAHAWAFLRDLGRLRDQARRAAVSPLGAGALATSTLGLDPAATARRLGFERPFENSLDAVSDRDAVQELLACCAILGTHCSRLAADVIRWTERGWAELDEAYATGSSMMPQKRNPDVLELARGKAGRLAAAFGSLAAVLAGLPLGYHRDLQEDKEPLFDAVDTLELVLPALVGCLETLRFDPAAMREEALAPELYATDVAEALVARGVAFRDAHRRVGELLRRLEGEGRTLRDLTPAEWEALGLAEGPALLDPDRSVGARSMPGGPAPASVLAQADAIEEALAALGG